MSGAVLDALPVQTLDGGERERSNFDHLHPELVNRRRVVGCKAPVEPIGRIVDDVGHKIVRRVLGIVSLKTPARGLIVPLCLNGAEWSLAT